jgi:hypothetical protein
MPYNGSIDYSISCSGNFSFKPSPYDPPETEISSPWSRLFKLSGSCSPGNCSPIAKMSWYHPTFHEEEPNFLCELNGTIGDESFITWNETGSHRYNLSDFYDVSMGINYERQYYNFTPEYRDCNEQVMKSISYYQYPCEQYLEEYYIHRSKGIDQPEGNWTQRQCAEIYNNEIQQCYPFLKKIDLTWTHTEPVIYIYRFNLSQGHGKTMENSLSTPHTSDKPVESLYCSLLNFLGAEC